MPTPPISVAPHSLPANPVWRSYTGGQRLRTFRGKGGTPDDHFPEDWLASTVRARNGSNTRNPMEGLSFIAGNGVDKPVLELFQREPHYWFGNQTTYGRDGSLGVLWKLLDSSVRLQLQAHPNADFARQHLNSNAGKTECWYILGTRGDAYVHLGFQNPPTRAKWGQMIREQSVDQMLGCFERIPVRAGECYVVPAGTPHAIGAGVFMVELMEPTDWVVRCETVTAGLTLPPEACFMGLGLEACLDIFDYHAYSIGKVRQTFQQSPRIISMTDSFKDEELIGRTWHQFFRLHRLRGRGDAVWSGNELMLLIVINGVGELSVGSVKRSLCAGETWLLPGVARQWDWRNNGSDWEVLLARLPIKTDALYRADPPLTSEKSSLTTR